MPIKRIANANISGKKPRAMPGNLGRKERAQYKSALAQLFSKRKKQAVEEKKHQNSAIKKHDRTQSTISNELLELARAEGFEPEECFSKKFLAKSPQEQGKIIEDLTGRLRQSAEQANNVWIFFTNCTYGRANSQEIPHYRALLEKLRAQADELGNRLNEITTEKYLQQIDMNKPKSESIGFYWHHTTHRLADATRLARTV